MNYGSVTTGSATIAFLAIASLSVNATLRADSILPTETFSCTGSSCSGSTTQLASADGVQGVEIDFTGSSDDASNPTFEYDIAGVLSGDSLPADALIFFTYSFTAESDNPDGTQIVSDTFVVPPFAAFNVISQSETITGDGPCTPDPPPPFSSWCRSVEGSGLLEFPGGLASGAPLDLGAQIILATINGGGEPVITLNGTVDFTGIPEPRGYGAMLATALLVMVCFRSRTALP
jgi:hypothetical protein